MQNIPTVTRNLLVINVIVYLLTEMLARTGIVDLNSILGLHFFLAPDFHVYQLFTYMFAHGGLSHIFFNMFALWMFGRIVETTWGARKFLVYYLVCGIGAGLFQELAQFGEFYMLVSNVPAYHFGNLLEIASLPYNANLLNLWTTVGASGAIYGILLAFGMLYPEERLFIFPLPVPIKAKWFVVGYAAIELFLAFSTTNDGVAHLAHLGGMVFGLFLIRYWRRHPDISYNRTGGRSFFDSLRSQWEQRTHRSAGSFGSGSSNRNTSGTTTASRETDWQYNARRKAEQEEVDRILDKIRRSGYDSLTREEKQRLFDNSRR